jgi:hypothetical protein
VEQAVLREALRHADLAMTSVYVKPEQRALLREMAQNAAARVRPLWM